MWSAGPLSLSADKAIRPRLLAHGSELHMVYDVWDGVFYTVHHAVWTGGAWGTPTAIASGEKASLAFDPDGTLHAVYFAEDGQVEHSMLVGGAWIAGDAVPTDAYMSGFRIRALTAPGGIESAVSTSPGGTSYDIRTDAWASGSGWTRDTLYNSLNLSSDEPEGALDSSGQRHWVWTEQDPADVWTVGIMLRSTTGSPTWVSRTSGFSASPAVGIPADDVPMVTWVDPFGQILVDRAPYGTPVTVGAGAKPAIAIDADGFTHVAWYEYGPSGPQEIFYTTNR